MLYKYKNELNLNELGGISLSIKHFIETDDFTKEEYLKILETIKILKEGEKKGIRIPLLKDMSLGMMFDQESTRTRVSFEVAMTQLGGHALYLSTKTLHCGSDMESIKDTALVLSSMCDAIEIRSKYQDTIIELAKYSTVPVINGMASKCMHPTQALCDIFTMMEHKPENKKLEDIVMMFIGDNSVGENYMAGVCRTLSRLTGKLGMTFISCAPEEAAMLPVDVEYCKKEMAKSGGKFIQTTNPYEYIDMVDFIYTDSWWYHGIEHLKDEKVKLYMPKYQINSDLISKGPAHIKVMHCLPGNRGYEITDEVWDGEHSIIIKQSENRLHTQKGILAWFLLPLKKAVDEEERKMYSEKITSYIMNNNIM